MKQFVFFALSIIFIRSVDIKADDSLSNKNDVSTLCQRGKFVRALSMIKSNPRLLDLYIAGEKNPLHYGAEHHKEAFVGEVYDLCKGLAVLKDDQGKKPYHYATSYVVKELFELLVNDERGDSEMLTR